MIKGPSGWTLAPAYDLLNVKIVLPEDNEELALTLEGKKRKLKQEHFRKFGTGLGLTEKQMDGAFSRMLENRMKAMEWIEKSFLPGEMRLAYKEVLDSKYNQLYLE